MIGYVIAFIVGSVFGFGVSLIICAFLYGLFLAWLFETDLNDDRLEHFY